MVGRVKLLYYLFCILLVINKVTSLLGSRNVGSNPAVLPKIYNYEKTIYKEKLLDE